MVALIEPRVAAVDAASTAGHPVGLMRRQSRRATASTCAAGDDGSRELLTSVAVSVARVKHRTTCSD